MLLHHLPDTLLDKIAGMVVSTDNSHLALRTFRNMHSVNREMKNSTQHRHDCIVSRAATAYRFMVSIPDLTTHRDIEGILTGMHINIADEAVQDVGTLAIWSMFEMREMMDDDENEIAVECFHKLNHFKLTSKV